MDTMTTSFGMPDIELGCSTGGKINPSSFVGHRLIALFCPLDAALASEEVAAYSRHSDDFSDHDAWLLTFADNCDAVSADGVHRMLTVLDRDRHAWVEFRDLTGRAEEFDRDSGATFLFTRAGGLERAWHGVGHVDEVLAELSAPSAEREHHSAG